MALPRANELKEIGVFQVCFCGFVLYIMLNCTNCCLFVGFFHIGNWNSWLLRAWFPGLSYVFVLV